MNTTCNHELPEELKAKLQAIATDLCANQMTHVELGEHKTFLEDASGRAAVLTVLNEYVIEEGAGRYRVELCEHSWFGDDEQHKTSYGAAGLRNAPVNSKGFGSKVLACAVIDSQADSKDRLLFTLSKEGMRYRKIVSPSKYQSRKLRFAINNRRHQQSVDGDAALKDHLLHLYQKLKERIAQFPETDDRRIDAEYHLKYHEKNIFNHGDLASSVTGTLWQRISAAAIAIGTSIDDLSRQSQIMPVGGTSGTNQHKC